MIERLIITGLIVSVEFIKTILPIYQSRFIGSDELREVAKWCLGYFDQYNEAPGKNIEGIYFEKLRVKEIDRDLASGVEDILSDLSEEYDQSFNWKYVRDEAINYFKERHLQFHTEEVQDLISKGDPESVAEAERLTSQYKPISFDIYDDLVLSDPKVLLRVENAFTEREKPILTYPGALGEFWNSQMVRGAFIGILAREKLGKTFLLLDMAMRGVRQKSKVAFFQAGDMTENQQLKRICSYLTKKPFQRKYCRETHLPVVDCIKNQTDTCDKEERECDFGPFDKANEKELRKEISLEMILKAREEFPDYSPCRNCEEFYHKQWGMPWIKDINIPNPVTLEESRKKIQQFFINRKRQLRISTHSNGTLSVEGIIGILDRWAKEEGFIPDIILVDYADLLITNKTKEFRHQQNQIWKDLRFLSQERNALVIAPTQSDSRSYSQSTLSLSNFSEDKRKYAHVTAMYGLNQDKENVNREKKIGLMRINELVVREGDFDSSSHVTVLQNLNIGRPFLGSFF